MRSRFLKLFDAVAGRPAQSSYTWSGYRSPVTFIAVWAVSVLRLFSPLQWLKHSYRTGLLARPKALGSRRRARRQSGSNRRVDVPPALTDWYFIVVLIGLFAAESRIGDNQELWAQTVLSFFAILLFVESVIWTLYYFLLVKIGHIEEDFVIWSPAEYLLLFPFQIAIQGIAISVLADKAPLDSALLLIGQGTPSDGLGRVAAALSVVYLGILIAALLGSLRPTRSRRTQFWVILGGGDVVKRLIIPALGSIGISKSQRMIVDVNPNISAHYQNEDFRQIRTGTSSDRSLVTDSELVSRQPGIYVIASPTETHVRYLKLAHAANRRAICEKPFTLNQRDSDFLQRNTDIFSNVFCLSYYSLDKGLALTYLLDPRVVYEKYLNFSSHSEASASDVLSGLGKLNSLSVTLIEPMTNRPQNRTETELRDLEDLIFHPFVLLSQLRHQNSTVQSRRLTFDPNGTLEVIIDVYLPESNQPTEARFLAAKSSSSRDKRREAWCTFEKGQIHMDYDSGTCRVFDMSGSCIWNAEVKSEYTGNYLIMFDMIHQWISKESNPRIYDHLPDLLWANEAWIYIRSAGLNIGV